MSEPRKISSLLGNLENKVIHLVGAKGTGMCALAEILVSRGAQVSGSDVEEMFYTDKILQEIGVPVFRFSADSLGPDTDLVVYSAAYGRENPVLLAAMSAGIPTLSYPEALGALSEVYDASAIAGVHGKTTTTALAGTILRELNSSATVVVGSAVAGFGDRSTWRGGDDFLVAETCEYRRHFLHFQARRIVLTSVESDHQDYYPDYDSIRDAFLEFVLSLPNSGELIYCVDDPGARDVAELAAERRKDIRFIPYGVSADGPWALEFSEPGPGINGFRVAGLQRDFHLNIPGRHIALDAVAALALAYSLDSILDTAAAARALAAFRGSRRRSEILEEVGGILVMDDYAHHPTAIAATLRGLKDFHPDRRLIVDFMPHTYSRTAALLDEFASSFEDADLLILHPIYASAREAFDGKISGLDLLERTKIQRREKLTIFHEEFDESLAFLKKTLRPGDLFITLGAGNNWSIGRQIVQELSQ